MPIFVSLDSAVYVGSTNEDEMCNFYMMYWVEGTMHLIYYLRTKGKRLEISDTQKTLISSTYQKTV